MSASPPALPLVSRSDALRARSCALLGSVNLTSLRAAVPFEQVSTAVRIVFAAPGVEVKVDAARAREWGGGAGVRVRAVSGAGG